MTTHHLALTIDTDPDGLNTSTPDRQALVWDGLEYAMAHFHEALPHIPLTWYIRADSQLEHAYGSARYLFDTYRAFWDAAVARGDECGWHPHLYTLPVNDSPPTVITDTQQAVASLQHTWEQLADVAYPLPSFRMGEAWHTPETLSLIEAIGFTIDSTAIPGRDDSASGHPRNWREAPNQPYYPAQNAPRLRGSRRDILEIPMNTWAFQTSYDAAPKLRYMNPCIHPVLWQQALERWQATPMPNDDYFWVMILHPAEAMPHDEDDLLYSYSLQAMQQNITMFEAAITQMGHDYQWTTIEPLAQLARTRLKINL